MIFRPTCVSMGLALTASLLIFCAETSRAAEAPLPPQNQSQITHKLLAVGHERNIQLFGADGALLDKRSSPTQKGLLRYRTMSHTKSLIGLVIHAGHVKGRLIDLFGSLRKRIAVEPDVETAIVNLQKLQNRVRTVLIACTVQSALDPIGT